MPRRRSAAPPSRSAPSRPTVAPSRPPPQPQRPASTAAHPNAGAQQNQQGQRQGPGLFGQMASTAAGVAVGSSIGHALGGMFGGNSQAAEANEAPNDAMSSYAQGNEQQNVAYRGCDEAAKAFTQCLDANQGNQHQMSICSWYLDQLKACQAAARNY